MRRIERALVWITLPAVLAFFAVYVLPFGLAAHYALVDSTVTLNFVGLAQYRETLRNEYFRLAMRNTLRFTLIAVPLMMSLAMALSLSLAKRRARWLSIFGLLPMLVPSASVILVFRILFDRWNGVLTLPLSWVGLPAEHMPALSLHVFFLWKNIGLVTWLLVAALELVPVELYEYARVESANPLNVWWHVTLPQTRPTLLFAATLTCVYSFRIFRESWLMYGSYPHTSIYFLQNYMNNHFQKINYQRLSTAAILFLTLICAIVAFAYRLDVRWREEV